MQNEKKNVKGSFLYYALFLSVLIALISDIDGFMMFIMYSLILTAILVITRLIYGVFEKIGVKIYERYVIEIIEKVKKTKKEIE